MSHDTTEAANMDCLAKSTWMPRAPSGMSPYIAGRCYEFALALATFLPSAEPVALMDGIELDHAGLLLADGRFVDVRGVSNAAAFTASFRAELGLPVKVAWDALVAECGIGDMTDPWCESPALAMALVDVKRRFPGLRSIP